MSMAPVTPVASRSVKVPKMTARMGRAMQGSVSGRDRAVVPDFPRA